MNIKRCCGITSGTGVNSVTLNVGQKTAPRGWRHCSRSRRLEDMTVYIYGTSLYEVEIKAAAETISNLTYKKHLNGKPLGDLRRLVTAAVGPLLWIENSSLIVYESFAISLSVVGSDIGGIPDLTADGGQDRLVGLDEATMLADAIRNLVSSPADTLTNLQRNHPGGRTTTLLTSISTNSSRLSTISEAYLPFVIIMFDERSRRDGRRS